MADAKPWYMSRVLWLNGLTAAATIAGDFAGILPAEWTPKIVALVAIINLVLRFLTTLPIVALLVCVGLSVSALAGEPPVGSSVRMVNGSTSQCSGTVFSKGENHAVAVGAAHCFAGRLGGEFDVRVGGKEAKATLIAHDPGKDLALWKLPASVVGDVALFPDEQPQGPMTAIGFPARAMTEHVKHLKYRAQYDQGGHYLWKCEVLEGTFAGGDSGGGVFLDGNLAGVISQKGTEQVCENGICRNVTYLHAVCYRDVRTFIVSHKDKWKDCVGDKSVPPPPVELGNIVAPKNGTFPDKESTAIILALVKRLDALEKKVVEKPDAPAVPGAQGDSGPKGEPGTAGQPGPAGVAGVSGKDGRDGVAGPAGPAGRITVVLIGPDGKEISRASDVVSGSVARLQVKQSLKGE